jgi:riboflavin kinase/FMN adenylyltransferase
VAVTFDPHPSQILRPDTIGRPLSTLADRLVLMQKNGADHVLILQTSRELLQLSARDFFEQIVLRQLGARALIEGYNFAFGHNREGTTEVLQSLCLGHEVALTLLPAREVLGRPVSSSRIREDLLAGRVDVAQQLLGRPHRIAGRVDVGQKRGASLGFPTANLHEIATLLPGNGVYAVRAIVDGATWPGAANIGPNPTFGENARKVEVHLIGFSGDIYDHDLAVEFVKKIRDTRAFADVSELTAQIQCDVATAQQYAGVS